MDKLVTLGIDWQSLLIYAVNFGILYAIAAKLLVPKILSHLENRQESIKNSIEEANRLKATFQAKMEEMTKEHETAKLEQMNELKEIKKTLENERADLIESMEAKRREMIEKTEKEIGERKNMLIKEAEKEMLEIIKNMVLHIVQNKIPSDVVNQSVNDAWKEYKK